MTWTAWHFHSEGADTISPRQWLSGFRHAHRLSNYSMALASEAHSIDCRGVSRFTSDGQTT
jgi:hypothetical protein